MRIDTVTHPLDDLPAHDPAILVGLLRPWIREEDADLIQALGGQVPIEQHESITTYHAYVGQPVL